MKTRPATRNEILRYCEGRRQSFETYCLETADHRTESGVRHIRRATATVRNVNGVPTVTRHGEAFELFGSMLIYDNGSECRIPTLLTIVKRMG